MFLCLVLALTTAGPRALLVTSDNNPMRDDDLRAAFVVPGGSVAVVREALVDRREIAEQDSAQHAAVAAQTAGQKLAVFLKDDAAIEKFEEALELYGRALPRLPSVNPVADCLIDLGAAWLDEGRQEKAASFFRRAASISPSAAVDPNRHNPSVTALYAKVQREVARATRLPLTVVTDPPGAFIRLDGAFIGTSPLTLAGVIAGEHWIVASKPGYHFFSAPYDIERGANARVELFLHKLDEASVLGIVGRNEQPEDAARFDRLSRSQGVSVIFFVAETGKSGRVWMNEKQLLSAPVSVDNESDLAAALQRFVTLQSSSAPIAIVASQPATVPGQPASISVRPTTSLNPVLAVLPFGVSEYLEQRPLAGSLFLSSEVLLLATNIATAVVVYNDRSPTTGTYQNGSRDRALQVVNLLAFAGLIADLVGNGVDGYLHRTF